MSPPPLTEQPPSQASTVSPRSVTSVSVHSDSSLTRSQHQSFSFPWTDFHSGHLLFPLPCHAFLTQGLPCTYNRLLCTPSPTGSMMCLTRADSLALPLSTISHSSYPLPLETSRLRPCSFKLSPFSPVLVAGDCQSLKFLYLDTLESQQEYLPRHLSEASFWGDPTNIQVEAGSLSFVNLDVQKLLETLITKTAELKIWKENEKEVQAGYHLTYLGKRIKSLGDKQDTLGCQHFWSIKGKAEQLLGPEKPLYPDILGTIYRRQAASSSGISFCTVSLWWLLSQFLGLL